MGTCHPEENIQPHATGQADDPEEKQVMPPTIGLTIVSMVSCFGAIALMTSEVEWTSVEWVAVKESCAGDTVLVVGCTGGAAGGGGIPFGVPRPQRLVSIAGGAIFFMEGTLVGAVATGSSAAGGAGPGLGSFAARSAGS